MELQCTECTVRYWKFGYPRKGNKTFGMVYISREEYPDMPKKVKGINMLVKEYEKRFEKYFNELGATWAQEWLNSKDTCKVQAYVKKVYATGIQDSTIGVAKL